MNGAFGAGGLVFDTVLIRTGETWHRLAIEEFFSLPLSSRIRHVIEHTVAFQLSGTEVDTKDALAALREVRLRASSA